MPRRATATPREGRGGSAGAGRRPARRLQAPLPPGAHSVTDQDGPQEGAVDSVCSRLFNLSNT
ncbi:MAG: hypothetical protein MZV64_28555 [Ignavibacteriales bacterium]|nr:hypothetical protein [Ignavibacteriales bacterium]